MARQRDLMRVGWQFERIRGGYYYRDAARALEPVWETLADLGIESGGRSRTIAAPPPVLVRVTAGKSDTATFATPQDATATGRDADSMAVSQVRGDSVDINLETPRRPAATVSESHGAAGEAEVHPLPLFPDPVDERITAA